MLTPTLHLQHFTSSPDIIFIMSKRIPMLLVLVDIILEILQAFQGIFQTSQQQKRRQQQFSRTTRHHETQKIDVAKGVLNVSYRLVWVEWDVSWRLLGEWGVLWQRSKNRRFSGTNIFFFFSKLRLFVRFWLSVASLDFNDVEMAKGWVICWLESPKILFVQ